MAISKADIREKIYRIEQTLKSLDEFKVECEKIFEEDPLKKDALLYRLYLLSDWVISLAEMVCKFRELWYPLTYSEFNYRFGNAGGDR